MRIQRFFVKEPIGEEKSVVIHDSELFHQLKHVFRMNIGGQVVLFDNSGYEYHVLISSFGHGDVTCAVVSKKKGKHESARELHLYCSLIKNSNFEWVVEKGTELGVSRFVPLISDRSEKKNLNIDRVEKIMREASEQSGRTTLPTLLPPMPFDAALIAEFPCFAMHPTGETFTVNHTQNFSPLGVFIGPEGGFTEREIFLFKKRKISVMSLGPQILRAETAAIAMASLILLQ